MIQALELHIVTLCAVILAAGPATRLWREVQNWIDRRGHEQQRKGSESQ
jgi:hypothetical protein